MAKPSLSKRQQRRIQANQQQACVNDQLGLVVSHQGWKIKVENHDGNLISCDYRKNLEQIVAGDLVYWQPEGENKGRITAIKPRHNLLSRQDVYNKNKAIAANLDIIGIVSSAVPQPNTYLINRYIAAACEIGAEPLLIFNKMDKPESAKLTPVITQYQQLGFTCLTSSTKNHQGAEEIKAAFAGKTGILAGLSGVGKSSIINWLIPDLEIQIGELSHNTQEGTHTTRASYVYHLNNGGHIIDSPGVRDFTPSILSGASVHKAFPEISHYADQCRFGDCTHQTEPGCEVKKALENHLISAERFEQFQRLIAELN